MQKSKIKNQNDNLKSKIINPVAKRHHNFDFCLLNFEFNRGITMLLVVAILSALMSISLGIFNIIYDQVRISGEIADSFLAFYSADQGIEKNLYLDRITNISSPYGMCSGEGDPCYTESGASALAGGCYDIAVKKLASATELKVLGQYPCTAGSLRIIKRGFNLTY